MHNVNNLISLIVVNKLVTEGKHTLADIDSVALDSLINNTCNDALLRLEKASETVELLNGDLFKDTDPLSEECIDSFSSVLEMFNHYDVPITRYADIDYSVNGVEFRKSALKPVSKIIEYFRAQMKGSKVSCSFDADLNFPETISRVIYHTYLDLYFSPNVTQRNRDILLEELLTKLEEMDRYFRSGNSSPRDAHIRINTAEWLDLTKDLKEIIGDKK